MNDWLATGKQILEAQPFSVLLGAELVDFREGRAELRLPVADRLKQQQGFVHGGVLCYLADNTLTYAGGSVLGTAVVTSELKINYLRPAVGDCLVARAEVVYSGRNQAVCRCDVFVLADGAESLCATAQGVVARLGSADGG
jgi:uncharacterized protein (TIGR00369 family)